MGRALIDLLAAMRRHFADGRNRGGAVAEEAARVLSALPDPVADPILPPPARHPVLRHLPPVLSRNVLEGRLASVGELLPWRYGYDPRPDAPGLENDMAWAEIVGPAAPIVSQRVGFGLTLIGPHTHYLPHRHPAVELYAVVSGTAAWTAAGRSAEQPPGAFILHPSEVVHAMRTADEALLAIYSWSGDIVSPTTYEGC